MPSRRRGLASLAMLALSVWAGADAAAQPATYAVDYVSTVATGRAMNEQGAIAGVRYTLPAAARRPRASGCPSRWVWSGDAVLPLPRLAGYSTVTAVSINASGWAADYAGDTAARMVGRTSLEVPGLDPSEDRSTLSYIEENDHFLDPKGFWHLVSGALEALGETAARRQIRSQRMIQPRRGEIT